MVGGASFLGAIHVVPFMVSFEEGNSVLDQGRRVSSGIRKGSSGRGNHNNNNMKQGTNRMGNDTNNKNNNNIGNITLAQDPPAPPTRPIERFDLLGNSTDWPPQPPRTLFQDSPAFPDCNVIFKDPAMAACHVAPFGGNFGDLMGPDIVKRILEYQFGCHAETLPVWDFTSTHGRDNITTTCLFTVGSVWRHVRANDHVWGTGMVGLHSVDTKTACPREENEENGCFQNITVHSVRGPGTVQRLKERCQDRVQVVVKKSDVAANVEITNFTATTTDLNQTTTAGDPGFLTGFLFPELLQQPSSNNNQDRNFDCIVLHKYDEETFNQTTDMANITAPNNLMFLPVIQSWEHMVGNISAHCRTVSSSSLHGLIVSDALGIPARWIRRSISILPFKFYDYGDSFGIRNFGNETIDAVSLDSVLQQQQQHHDSRNDLPDIKSYEYRSAYAKRILASFPFELFTTASTTDVQTIAT